MPIDLSSVLNSLSHEQMELLIRRYIAQCVDGIELVSHVQLMSNAEGKATWHLFVRPDKSTYDTTVTKGEILSRCASEARRRKEADNSNKLLMIEAPADDVPF